MPSQQNNRSDDSEASRTNGAREDAAERGETAVEEEVGTGVAAPAAKGTAERASGDDTESCKSSDNGKRKTKTLIVTGSAGGWVEVWEAEGLVAAAGVDE